MYAGGAVERVRVIQAALRVGFTLAELRVIFAARAAGRAPCRQVRVAAGEKLRCLDDQIAALTAARGRLAQTLIEFDLRLANAGSNPARLLEALADRAFDGPLLRVATPPRRVRGTK